MGEKTRPEMLYGIKAHLRKTVDFTMGVDRLRQEEAALTHIAQIAPGTTVEKATVAGLHAEWVRAVDAPEDGRGVVLYLHGGGFITGSCDTHRDIAARISAASGVRVLVVEYRRAPEHRYPAANDDCLAAYRWLLQNGFERSNIVLGGESVGATLVLMTLLSLRDSGEPLPAAAFLMSPHTDLVDLDGESFTSRAQLDPTGSAQGTRMCAEYYFGAGPMPEMASPLKQSLHGLPSLLIQVGDHEVLRDDSTRLAERAKTAGVDVTLEIWENMWHAFQFLAAMIPEGREAIGNIGSFIKSSLG